MADDKPTPAAPRGQAWRAGSGSTAGSTATGKSRTRRLLALGAVFLAMLGALVGVLYLLQKPESPYLLTVPMSEYTDPLFPPLPFARQDSDRLAEHFPENRRKNVFTSQQLKQLETELDGLAKVKGDTCIVHLRAHALCEGDEVYLIPGDARADQSSTWLKLKDALARVEAARPRNRLLLLDLSGTIADPRLGQLDDDLAKKVLAILRARENPKVVVLCACSEQEISLVSEELGCSVFGYYLDLGMRGWADGALDGRRDDNVSARELAEYVKRSVQRWAVMNRGLKQTPILVGPGEWKDFSLRWIRQEDQRTRPEPVTPPAYPEWLVQGWQLRQRWADEGVHRLAPLEYRKLEARLLWAEQNWWSGKDPTGVQREFGDRQAELVREVSQAREVALLTQPPRPASLAQLGLRADEGLRAELETAVRRVEALKPDERPAFTKAWQNKPRDPKVKDGPTLSYNELAALVWEVAQRRDGIETQARLQWLVELLTGHPSNERPPYVEILLLNRLAAWKKIPAETWPQAVQVLLPLFEAVREFERALAGDPWALQWERQRLLALSERLRKAQEEIYLTHLWEKEAPGVLGDLIREARSISTEAQDLEDGRKALDRGAVVLPACLYYFLQADRVDESVRRDWDDAREASGELRKLLNPPSATKPDVPRLKEQSDRLTRALNRLVRPFEIQAADRTGLKSLVDVALAPPSTYNELRARFASPLLSLQDRQEVLKAMRTLGQRLNSETEKLDSNGMPAGETQGGQIPGTVTAAAADRRGRFVIDLLQLAELKMDPAMTRAPFDPFKLRDAWAVRLPQELARASAPAEELRLLQGIHPYTPVTKRPGAQARRLERADHWRWLGETFYESQRAFYAERTKTDSSRMDYKQLQDFYDALSREFGRAGQL